jgi:hypothetical protein
VVVHVHHDALSAHAGARHHRALTSEAATALKGFGGGRGGSRAHHDALGAHARAGHANRRYHCPYVPIGRYLKCPRIWRACVHSDGRMQGLYGDSVYCGAASVCGRGTASVLLYDTTWVQGQAYECPKSSHFCTVI